MSEEDEENIEKFFRAGLQRQDIVKFNEHDWLALKARMDAEAARSAKIHRERLAFFSACFVVTLSTFLFFWQKSKNVNDRPDQHSIADSGSEGKASIDSSANQKRHETVVKPQQVPVKIPENDPIVTTKPSESLRKHLSKRGSSTDATVSVVKMRSAEETQHLSIVLDDRPLSRPLAEGYEIALANDLNISDLKLADGQVDKDSSLVPTTTRQQNYFRPYFSFMLFASPEFSFSKQVRVTSPGSDLGMALYFHFNETMSFSAGLVASKKKYVSSGSEYEIREGYWKANTNGIVPEKIFGSCSIVEIPLMLQLRLLGTEKNHFFIASGTSSYLMLNESYNYQFEQPNPGAKDGWASEKNTTFAFSTINFSISYERNISRSITVGLEPYAKLPVKKIGWPNLKLFSSGVNVNLRYKILR